MFQRLSVLLLLFSDIILASEFIPVLLWESSDPLAQKSAFALQKISTERFSDLLMSKLANKDLVLLFAEENLSTEDFSWKDEGGMGAFGHLDNLTAQYPLSTQFLPAVDSPLDSILQDQKWKTLPLTSDLPAVVAKKGDKIKFLKVRLDDAGEGEDRLDMLRRHDSAVSEVLSAAGKAFKKVFAVYTGRHASWVPAEESLRRVRSLLGKEDKEDDIKAMPGFVSGGKIAAFYTTGTFFSSSGQPQPIDLGVPASEGVGEEAPPSRNVNLTVIYNSTENTATVQFQFVEIYAGYWSVLQLVLTEGEKNPVTLAAPRNLDITAPYGFSYHCSEDVVFLNKDANMSISFQAFQIQAYPKSETEFNKWYDCTYFFTMPILSGILVTFLLAIIMGIGLTMIIDIRTMDKFDDPKGKTITISATDN